MRKQTQITRNSERRDTQQDNTTNEKDEKHGPHQKTGGARES